MLTVHQECRGGVCWSGEMTAKDRSVCCKFWICSQLKCQWPCKYGQKLQLFRRSSCQQFTFHTEHHIGAKKGGWALDGLESFLCSNDFWLHAAVVLIGCHLTINIHLFLGHVWLFDIKMTDWVNFLSLGYYVIMVWFLHNKQFCFDGGIFLW